MADPAALQQLVNAYGAPKALLSPPDSPINWCNQANIHYNHCSFPGPNAYYLQIHFGWLFFPWHRGYLYFYETILGGLIGDTSFALPYWDWTTTPVVPDVFFDVNSPLYDPNRSIVAGQSIVDDPEVYYYTQASYITYLENLPNYSPPASNPQAPSFGGPPDDDEGNAQFQGKVEAGPHDAVHSWVGGDMGSFDTAARDLLFFGHHANVDRLWWLWQQGAGHANPTSPTWLNQWFNFWNAQANPVSMTVADAVNPQAVNVVYKALPQALAAAAPRPRASGREEGFVAEGNPVTLPLASKQRALVARESLTAFAAGELHLEGVETPHQRGIRLRVFINKPDADASTPITDPHYVGTIFLVPMRSQPPLAANQHGMPAHCAQLQPGGPRPRPGPGEGGRGAEGHRRPRPPRREGRRRPDQAEVGCPGAAEIGRHPVARPTPGRRGRGERAGGLGWAPRATPRGRPQSPARRPRATRPRRGPV